VTITNGTCNQCYGSSTLEIGELVACNSDIGSSFVYHGVCLKGSYA
jgi:hypothetical protein